jgi:hypothetical protein
MKKLNNRKVMEQYFRYPETYFPPEEGESHTGNLSFCGKNAYTYYTILAHWRSEGETPDRVCELIVNATKYSSTSSKHLSHLRAFIRESGVRVHYVTGLPRGASENTLMRAFLAQQEDLNA